MVSWPVPTDEKGTCFLRWILAAPLSDSLSVGPSIMAANFDEISHFQCCSQFWQHFTEQQRLPEVGGTRGRWIMCSHRLLFLIKHC